MFSGEFRRKFGEIRLFEWKKTERIDPVRQTQKRQKADGENSEQIKWKTLENVKKAHLLFDEKQMWILSENLCDTPYAKPEKYVRIYM